jgi:glycosyltransferase involved in cell wall biosynthesis
LKANTKVRKNLLVFLGILSKDQGIENLIKAMPKILNKNPDVKLRIIGSGNEMENIKKLSKYLDIDKNVEFLGFIKENREVDKLLQECKVGIAPYLLSKNSFKYYTDPGKIKTYLGAGLPIVMSDISNIAKVIRDRKAGIIINDKIDEIAQAVNSIFSNVREYDKLQKNAFALSKEYSWKNIFNKAFESLEKNV